MDCKMMSNHKFKETEIGLIPEDWEVKELSSLGQIITGKTPSTKEKENFGTDYPFITPRDMKGQKFISKTERYLSEKGKTILKNCLLPNKTVCVSCIGSNMGKVVLNEKPSITNQQLNSIVTEEINPEFVYYALLNITKRLKDLAFHSTAVPILNKKHFSMTKIALPCNQTEINNITKILTSLDEKIEVNNEMNRTLEAMGQAIFLQWFVHFEFPDSSGRPYKFNCGEMVDSELGKIPVGWEVGTLADICELNINSLTPKTMPEKIHYVDLANTKNGIISDVQIFDANEAPSRAKRILSPGDTIFGTVRPGNRSFTLIGNQKYLTGSTGFAVLTPNDPKLREIVYLITTSEENINRLTHLADGAAYPAVLPNVVTDEICLLPTEDVIKSFHNVVGPLFDLIISNRDENVNLSKIRDSLLPKLMTGKIRVVR
jgi:type I restriction enzyme S subunit